MGFSATVQAVFQVWYPALEQTQALVEHVRVAAWCIIHCRTATLGGHVWKCPNGCTEKPAYNACRNRACNQCQQLETENWLRKQKAKLLACRHHHVIFTISHDLNVFWPLNAELMGTLLFHAARDTLFKLLADPTYMGGVPGLLGALQTWGEQLWLHPHAHFIVTAGGLSPENEWVPAKRKCLLPRNPVMQIFRAKYRDGLLAALKSGELGFPKGMSFPAADRRIRRACLKKWNVKILPSYDHANGVLAYLARYLRQGCLSNKRIRSFDGETVTFEYEDNRTMGPGGQTVVRPKKLGGREFVRRVLQHVPPPGFHTCRHYGLYSSNSKEKLATARAQLGQGPVEEPELLCASEFAEARDAELTNTKCPKCGARLDWHLVAPKGSPPSSAAEAAA